MNHLRVLLTVTGEGTKESRTSSFQRVKRKGRRRRKIPSFWQWSTRRRVPPPDLNLEQRLVGAPPSPGSSIKNAGNVRSSIRNRSAVNSEEIESGNGQAETAAFLRTIARHVGDPVICPLSRRSRYRMRVNRPTDWCRYASHHVDQDLRWEGSFDMWGSGQEIVSRVRATGVKQGNRKLFLSLSLPRRFSTSF